MGLCISYDRLLSLSTDIANTVCASYESEGVVCLPKLKSSLFTTAAVDNIDHNPSSTTAQDSFHGTTISLVQHPTDNESGTEREQPTIQSSAKSSKTVAALPSSFTEVAPASLKTDAVSSPQSIAVSKHLRSTDCKENKRESDWLENVKEILSKEKLGVSDVVSWATYRASQISPMSSSFQPAIISFFPLFQKNAHSVAMILHAMNVV